MGGFQSEAYRDFLDSHTQLNNYIKVSTVAVDFLYNSTTDKEELSALINDLILKSGERWTPRIIKDPKSELKGLKNDLVKSAIIWVYSAFDVYFKQIEGMLSSHFPKAEKKKFDESEDDNKNEHKVIELYQRLDWDKSQIEGLLLILKFYEALRHSVAHNLGKPSGKLIEIWNDPEFTEAIRNWKTKFPPKSISPPPIVSNNIIQLKPHDSIIYSETCLRIAGDINNRLFMKLGISYFVNKTIKKHLVDTEKLSKPDCQNLTRYLVYHLKNDYEISIKPYDSVFEGISVENMKIHKKRYSTLKNISNLG